HTRQVLSPFGRGLSFARPGSHSQCLPRHTATHDTGIDASKMMEYPKRKFVTAVTSSEAGSEHVNRAVDTDAPPAPQTWVPRAAEAGRLWSQIPPTRRACPRRAAAGGVEARRQLGQRAKGYAATAELIA